MSPESSKPRLVIVGAGLAGAATAWAASSEGALDIVILEKEELLVCAAAYSLAELTQVIWSLALRYL